MSRSTVDTSLRSTPSAVESKDLLPLVSRISSRSSGGSRYEPSSLVIPFMMGTIMKNFCLENCRMGFRLRTRQFRCRVNMPKLFGGVLWCHACSTGPEDGPDGGPAPLESQSHLEVCVAYSHLRVAKDVELNFKDKTKYFIELSVEREKRKWN